MTTSRAHCASRGSMSSVGHRSTKKAVSVPAGGYSKPDMLALADCTRASGPRCAASSAAATRPSAQPR